MSRHLMLVPSLACPASCAYCFGPRGGGPPMRQEAVEAVIRWQSALDGSEPLEITFHGGEPLVPGVEFYRMGLPLLREGLAPHRVRLGVQSNLWLLTGELCELFREYGVSLGTSLDGPEPINDAQRGTGYFRRTMSGIERARAYGLDVGCICTFTAQSAPHAGEIFDFFAREGLGFSIHAALPSLNYPDNGWTLSPQAHGQLLVDMLERYLADLDRVRISTLDAMCRSVSAGQGGICTFGDCLGQYLAVDPEGWIYACQRLAGMPEYQLGNVHDCPSPEMLSAAPAWRAFRNRQERIAEECGDCPHLGFCRGGCPYNALVANGGDLTSFRNPSGLALRDPHCPAYRRVFSYVTDRALEEVFSEENLAAVVDEGPGKYGLLRKGRLLQLMRGGPHPQKVAQRARELVAVVALAVSQSPEEALCKLDRAGLITQPELALRSLTALRHRLDTQSQQGLANAYIHVTYACNLACTHCYASSQTSEVSETSEVSPAMAVDDVVRLVHEAAQAGFRKAVITGGEPLVHPQRDALLDALAALREEVKPLQTVLRTNLAYPLTPALIERLVRSTDQIVVSVDGSEASHDARRGAGTYARTVANLRALTETLETLRVSENPKGLAEVGITAVLTADQVGGPEGEAVRALGKELGVQVRFKSVLPLGRGADLGLRPAFYSSLGDGAEAIACGARTAATCGLGMNLYVGPDGACYPCYALTGAGHYLGNVLDDGLAAVIARNDAYRLVTVDSNRRCRACTLRYMCGGFCRAWGSSGDPDSPPTDCTALHERARGLLQGALEALDVRVERWLAAGLPLPEVPPQVR